MSRVQPGTFDWPGVFAGVTWFHTSGITAALSPEAAAAVHEALTAAKAAGLGTSFDLNYRSKLWSAEEAGRTLGPMMPLVDVLIASEGDATALFGVTGATFADASRRVWASEPMPGDARASLLLSPEPGVRARRSHHAPPCLPQWPRPLPPPAYSGRHPPRCDFRYDADPERPLRQLRHDLVDLIARHRRHHVAIFGE